MEGRDGGTREGKGGGLGWAQRVFKGIEGWADVELSVSRLTFRK